VSLISLVDASKDFGIRTLFADLTLHIREGDRLGLIGPNGSGKVNLAESACRRGATWGRRTTLLVAVEG
jgi:ATPase subunit of ABC transporter with duplicated ATPase domains